MTTPNASKVSPTCQHRYDRGHPACGKPTAWWYPTATGDTMARCTEHGGPYEFYGACTYVPPTEPAPQAVEAPAVKSMTSERRAHLEQITETLRGETGRRGDPLYAYYYGFSLTGCLDVDRILAWVATAGKGYHHTDGWSEGGYDEMIQVAAERATARIAELEAKLDAAEKEMGAARRYILGRRGVSPMYEDGTWRNLSALIVRLEDVVRSESTEAASQRLAAFEALAERENRRLEAQSRGQSDRYGMLEVDLKAASQRLAAFEALAVRAKAAVAYSSKEYQDIHNPLVSDLSALAACDALGTPPEAPNDA